MKLKRFVAATITPVVLITGFLGLAVVHFHSSLKAAEQNSSTFRGFIAYYVAPYNVNFERDSSSDRPLVGYDRQDAIQYQEEASSVVVDGLAYPLWQQSHGYSFQDSSDQIFSTVSGPGWQVIQVTTLSHAATTVAYSFVVTSVPDENLSAGTPPRTVTLEIVHQHNYWLNPAVSGLQFQAGISSALQNQVPNLLPPTPAVRPQWSIAVAAQPAPGVDARMALNPVDSSASNASGPGAVGTSGGYTWGNEFITSYTLTNPPLNTLTPIATEVITGQTVAGN